LFTVACCDDIIALMKDERSVRAVRVTELFADGLATEEERRAAADAAYYAAYAAYAAAYADAAYAAAYAAADAYADAANVATLTFDEPVCKRLVAVSV
jgi:hypothetical protein